MTPVLDRLHINVAQITDLLVTAKIVNVGKVAAGADDVDVAVLADELLRLRYILGEA